MEISAFSLAILDGASESYLRGLYGNLKTNFKMIILSKPITTFNPGTQTGIFRAGKVS